MLGRTFGQSRSVRVFSEVIPIMKVLSNRTRVFFTHAVRARRELNPRPPA